MHILRHPLLLTTCALAAGLSALSARPAAAQYGTLNLSSGDVITVTAAGTFSNRPGGTSTTSTYDAGDNFEAVDAEAGSAFTLAGGALTGESGDSALYASGATILVSSGSVSSTGSGTDGVDATNGSTVTISGGRFVAQGSGGANASPGGPTFLATPGTPLSTVALYAESRSTITVTGGLFTTSGTGAGGLFAQSGGVITLSGTGFTVNGLPAGGPITTGNGTISGTLLNGNVLTSLPYTVLGGTIQFAPAAAPEPSQFAALAFGTLGVCVLALRARRRSVTA